MNSEIKDKNALEMHLAAKPIEEIRDLLNFKSVASAKAAIQRAMRARGYGKDGDILAKVELERLDAIYRVLYPKAMEGEGSAIDRCIHIGEVRRRLLADDKRSRGNLLKAFEKSVKAMDSIDAEGVDAALVEAGKSIARQIDYAVKYGVGQEVTKALYLLPHLMNVLRELGATPQSRAELGTLAKASLAAAPGAGITSLDQFKKSISNQ